ncbi:hypothetical protein, partial [Sporolactobacillus spathodeae]|uniref:hypothetical protein n=1 Tax=Sporolactobacillus spathodeae TaxID=1465502 RepID=UPI0039E7AD59
PLSSSVPMVVGGCPPARVGHCQANDKEQALLRNERRLFFFFRNKNGYKILHRRGARGKRAAEAP